MGCSTSIKGIVEPSLIIPVQSDKLEYLDNLVGFRFQFASDAIQIYIENLGTTQKPIFIHWDKSSYINEDSEALKVVCGNIKIKNLGESQTPTVIPPYTHIYNFLLPYETIKYDDKKGLIYQQLFNITNKTSASFYTNKLVGLFFTIESENKLIDYTFIFKINKIKIISISGGGGWPDRTNWIEVLSN
jgi:hypothetical protein